MRAGRISRSQRMSRAMLKIKVTREDDGRWLGEVSELPG